MIASTVTTSIVFGAAVVGVIGVAGLVIGLTPVWIQLSDLRNSTVNPVDLINQQITTTTTTRTTTTTTTTTTATTTTKQPKVFDPFTINKNLNYYWKFNGNLNEIVSSTSVTNQLGVSYVPDRNSISSSALYLNNGFIQLSSGIYIFSGDYTISAWIRIRQYTAWSSLISFGSSPQTDDITIYLSSSTNGLPVVETFNNGASKSIRPASRTIPLNEWQYVAFTLSGTNGVLYLNGQNIATGTLNSPRSEIRTLCFIGKSNRAQSQNANIEIDELRVFGRSMDQSEILILYGVDTYQTLTSKLQNYWPFDSNLVNDLITSAATLTSPSGTRSFVNDRNSNRISALYLNNAFYQIPSNSILVSNQFSLMTWIRMRSFSSSGSCLIDLNWGTNRRMNIVILSTGRIRFRWTSKIDLTTTSSLTLSRWSLVTFTVSATTATIYLDGVSIGSATLTSNSNTAASNLNYLGRCVTLTGISNLNAELDDLKIFGSDLTPAEILYSQTYDSYSSSVISNFAYYWKLQNNLNEERTDTTNALRSSVSTSFIINRFSESNFALNFNNGYLSAPVQTFFFGNNDFTIMAWLNMQSITNSSLLCFTQSTNPTNNYIAVLLSRSDSVLRPYFEISSNGVRSDYSQSSLQLTLGVWQHLAITFSKSNNVARIYINGRQVSEDRISQPLSVTRNSNFIGRCAQIFPNLFLSSNYHLDDLVIYDNRAFSQTDIIMRLSYDMRFQIKSSLTNSWKFDSTLIDQITKFTPTIVGSNNLFVQDRYNVRSMAYYLNLGYLQLPNGIYFGPRGFSISLWLRLRSITKQTAILDIGNSNINDNIIIFIQSGLNIVLRTYNNGNLAGDATSGSKIVLNQWTHILITLNGQNRLAVFYINGLIDRIATSNAVRSVQRTSNFIGESNLLELDVLNGDLDDIEFYDRELTNNEVNAVYNSYFF